MLKVYCLDELTERTGLKRLMLVALAPSGRKATREGYIERARASATAAALSGNDLKIDRCAAREKATLLQKAQ